MKKILTGFLFLILIFSPKKIFATTPLISNNPASVNINEEFSVDVSFSGLTENKVYRLRGAFVNSDGQYFCETWNNNEWYKAESPIVYSKFLSITTSSEGSWSGQLRAKVEYGIPNFSGQLINYEFQVGRYTETGTSATWSNRVNIEIKDPNPPTPTPTDEPAPTDEPTPTNEPTDIPNTPVPTKAVISITPTKKPTPTLTQKKKILGEKTEATISAAKRITATPTIKAKSVNSSSFIRDLPKLLIVFGILSILGMAGTFFFSKRL